MGNQDDDTDASNKSKSDIYKVKYILLLDGDSRGSSLKDLSLSRSENKNFTLWNVRQKLRLRKDTRRDIIGAGKYLFLDSDGQPIPRRLERELGVNDFAKRNKKCMEKLMYPCKRILKLKRVNDLETCHLSFFHGCVIAGSPAIKFISQQCFDGACDDD